MQSVENTKKMDDGLNVKIDSTMIRVTQIKIDGLKEGISRAIYRIQEEGNNNVQRLKAIEQDGQPHYVTSFDITWTEHYTNEFLKLQQEYKTIYDAMRDLDLLKMFKW